MQGNEREERYALGDLVLDVPAARLSRSGNAIEISGLTFDLLVYLVRAAPAIATHQELLDGVWSDATVGEETLKQRIRLLRRALGDDSKAPKYVRTVRGRGYQWLTPVQPVLPSEQQARSDRGKWVLVTVVLVLATMAVIWVPDRSDRVTEISDTSSVEELYQRARDYYRRYQPDDNDHAIALLKRAVEIDPQHAEAYALMSRAYSQQPKLGNGYWGDQALEAAEKAIALAPLEASGLLALGIYHGVKGQSTKAIEAYEQALVLEPDNGIAWGNSAYDLLILGRLDEALIRNIEGMRLNPDGHFGMVQMGDMLRLLGFPQKAETWFQKAITLQPDNLFSRTSYSRLLMLSGRYDAARELLEGRAGDLWGGRQARTTRGDIFLFEGDVSSALEQYRASWEQKDLYGGFRLAALQAAEGDAEAESLIDELRGTFEKVIEEGYEGADYRYYSAALALASNDREEALEWLDRAISAGWRDVAWTLADPALEELRGAREFETLIAKMRSEIARQRAELERTNRLP